MATTTFTAEPGTYEMVMSRLFDAPRELVFKACTDPEAIPQWWGPRELTTTVDRLDARHGGVWRYVQRDADGNEYAFRGVFHQVAAPALIIQTFEWEGMPDHVALETMTLEDVDGKTRITARSVFQTIEDRDGFVQSGAESGAVESWERLAEYLERVAVPSATGAGQ